MCGRDQHDTVERLFSNGCILFCASQYYTVIVFANYQLRRKRMYSFKERKRPKPSNRPRTFMIQRTIQQVINHLRYADDTTLLEESEEELRSLLKKVKEESEKVGFKHSENEDHGIWSHHFLANRCGDNANSDRLYIFGLQNHCRW